MMNSPNKLIQFVRKARRRLALEHYIRMLQLALFYGFTTASAILFVSRLFVFPYYYRTSIIVGSTVFVAVFLYAFWKRPSKEVALHNLDAFFPDNLLITSVSFLQDQSSLIKELVTKAEQSATNAFEKFKQRDKQYFQPKWIIGFVIALSAMVILTAFPAATQLEALDIEKEQEVVKEIKKEVNQLEKKEQPESIKKELEELKEKLKEVETAEEALREVVKKQKELALKEQKLLQKQELSKQEGSSESSLSAEEQKELAALEDISNSLAKSASSSQTALSKMGKSFPFTPSEIAQGESKEGGSPENKDQEEGQEQGEGQGARTRPRTRTGTRTRTRTGTRARPRTGTRSKGKDRVKDKDKDKVKDKVKAKAQERVQEEEICFLFQLELVVQAIHLLTVENLVKGKLLGNKLEKYR